MLGQLQLCTHRCGTWLANGSCCRHSGKREQGNPPGHMSGVVRWHAGVIISRMLQNDLCYQQIGFMGGESCEHALHSPFVTDVLGKGAEPVQCHANQQACASSRHEPAQPSEINAAVVKDTEDKAQSASWHKQYHAILDQAISDVRSSMTFSSTPPWLVSARSPDACRTCISVRQQCYRKGQQLSYLIGQQQTAS